ncbi:hypothetical protein AC1031_000096 [Aphanomyces cochlioides]|nr:hypothetical protein AC1031_000096 [Aphanomyces cochlioides]
MSRQTPPLKAGTKQAPSTHESSAACLSFPGRPGTPEAVRKYRKSYFAEPGTRIVHPGLIDDIKQLDANRKFGVTSKNSDHVTDVLPSKFPSEHALLTQAKLEAVYLSSKREPLGVSFTRGHNVDHSATFGAPSGLHNSDMAKELLYYAEFNETPDSKALYKRSHGSSDPGEQKNRQYDVPFDLHKARHGAAKKKEDSGGVSAVLNPEMDEQVSKLVITQKNVEDMKNTMDMLGRPRNLGCGHLPDPDHVFGVKQSKDGPDAATCIHGSYSFEEQQPDPDLGKPINRGWMNATADQRAFGVPSIRSDVAPPSKRSIADAQNYGDDVNAHELLYPNQYSALGVSDSEFAIPRSKSFLCDLFSKIGYPLPADIAEQVYRRATMRTQHTPIGVASIHDFQEALNDYLDAKDSGPAALSQWKAQL